MHLGNLTKRVESSNLLYFLPNKMYVALFMRKPVKEGNKKAPAKWMTGAFILCLPGEGMTKIINKAIEGGCTKEHEEDAPQDTTTPALYEQLLGFCRVIANGKLVTEPIFIEIGGF